MTVTRRAGLEALLASTLAQIHDSHFYIIPAAIASDVGLDDSGDTGEGTTGLSVRIAGDRALVWRVESGSPAALAAITPGEAVEQVNDRVVRTSIGGILSLPDASRQRALSELDFRVQRLSTFSTDAFPTNEVYGPTPGPELRLITCGGSYSLIRRQYLSNVVAYTSLVATTPATTPAATPAGPAGQN